MTARMLRFLQPAYEATSAASRSDHVYRILREELMRGALKPHERLRIRDLARALDTSETPVREAIFQLVRDGALELKPHAWVRVRRLSLSEYLEGRDIRLMLEPFAAERALANVTAADIAAERVRDYPAAVLANYDFHFGLYRRSGLGQVIEILETLWMQLGPVLTQFLYREGKPYEAGEHQHDAVLDALERRDAKALKRAVRADIIEGGRNFVRVLTKAEAGA